MRFQGCLYSSICVPYSICASNAYSICKDQFEYLSKDQFEQVDKENTIYLEIDFHFNMCSFRDLQFQWCLQSEKKLVKVTKFIVIKSCSKLFLLNRILDLGWFRPVGQFRVHEFLVLFITMLSRQNGMWTYCIASWTFNFLELQLYARPNVYSHVQNSIENFVI